MLARIERGWSVRRSLLARRRRVRCSPRSALMKSASHIRRWGHRRLHHSILPLQRNRPAAEMQKGSLSLPFFRSTLARRRRVRRWTFSVRCSLLARRRRVRGSPRSALMKSAGHIRRWGHRRLHHSILPLQRNRPAAEMQKGSLSLPFFRSTLARRRRVGRSVFDVRCLLAAGEFDVRHARHL
jgi:hypothetical protein